MKPSSSKDSNQSQSNRRINKADLNNDLIEFVRLNSILYDFKDPNYTSVQLKNSIWQQFADKYDMEITDVKSRWNVLRTGFTTAKKRFENGLVKDKKWEYLDRMMYLSEYLKPNDNIFIPSKRSKDTNGTSNNQQSDENEFDDDEDGVMPEADQELYEESIPSNGDSNEQQQKARLNNYSLVYDPFSRKVEHSNHSNHTNHSNHDQLFKQYLEDLKNPTMLFLKSLIPSLSKYTDEQLNVVKYRLMGVLIEADKEFKEQS